MWIKINWDVTTPGFEPGPRTSGQVKHAKPHLLYIKLQTIYILAGFKLLQLKTCRFGLLSRNVQIVYDTKVELNVMGKKCN